MKTFVVSSLFVLGLTGAAFAQAAVPAPTPVPPDFATLDVDGSGGISLTEAQVAFPNLTVEPYAAADTDANGELSEAEFSLAAGAAATASPAL